jgi:hypothetical protein
MLKLVSKHIDLDEIWSDIAKELGTELKEGMLTVQANLGKGYMKVKPIAERDQSGPWPPFPSILLSSLVSLL